MSSPKNSIEEVAKVLGEPAFAEFPENVWKIRTNLIVTSVITIAVVFGDLHIEPDSQIFGLKFKGLSDTLLTDGLIAVVIYLLVHFLWASMDSLLEWRLRVTGTRVAFVTTARIASEYADYPSDARQSTLYNWWKDQAREFGDITEQLVKLEARLQEWETQLKSKFTEGADAMNITSAVVPIEKVCEDIMRLRSEIASASAAVASARIPFSLARFDAWFALFLRSQNLRWLLIDFLAPVLVGFYAICLLLSR